MQHILITLTLATDVRNNDWTSCGAAQHQQADTPSSDILGVQL